MVGHLANLPFLIFEALDDINPSFYGTKSSHLTLICTHYGAGERNDLELASADNMKVGLIVAMLLCYNCKATWNLVWFKVWNLESLSDISEISGNNTTRCATGWSLKSSQSRSIIYFPWQWLAVALRADLRNTVSSCDSARMVSTGHTNACQFSSPSIDFSLDLLGLWLGHSNTNWYEYKFNFFKILPEKNQL